MAKRINRTKNLVKPTAITDTLLDNLFEAPGIYTNNMFLAGTQDGFIRMSFAENCEGDRVKHRGTYVMSVMQLQSMYQAIGNVLEKNK